MKLLNYSVLIILILFSVQTCRANSALYFGDYTPIEEIAREIVLQFSAPAKDLAAVEIALKNNYFQAETNQIIAGERLEVKTTHQSYVVNNKITRINSSELYSNSNSLFLVLIFTATPIDSPGEYRNKLLIRKIYNEGIKAEEAIEKEIIVKINPWVKINKIKEQSKVVINSSNYHNKNLFSRSMPIIKVAANTNWRLYAVIESEKNKLFKMLKIIIPNQSEDYTSIEPEGVYLNFEDQIIAGGGKTIDEDHYWVEVPCSLAIDDFTKVEAGTINFPINFYVTKQD